jgi:PKD repeat protein
MRTNRAVGVSLLALGAALLLNACQDSAQSPPERPERPLDEDIRADGVLAPIDLVYVCGNKFLATNSTGTAVQVEFRVLGSSEAGSMTLSDGSDEHAGHSETELQTTARGTVELYRDGDRVARRHNESRSCGPQPTSASIAGLSEAERGSWSGPFPWTGVATHLSLLSTGKVLSWGETVAPQVWDPSAGNFKAVPSPALLFCAGHAFLADGRLLVVGGHITTNRGLRDLTVFDPVAESWSRSAPMRRGRWYPTVTTLASGDALILFGTDETGVRVDEPEIWSGGALRALSTTTWGPAYYPRNFLAPNGRLFFAGETQRSRYLDYTGAGSWKPVGDRVYGKRDYGAAVMYDAGKILYVGGGRSTNTAEIIDLNSATPAWQWTGSMAVPRRHLNATVLPTGEVLVTGGVGGTAFNDLTKAARAAELWSPTTGTWTTLASSAVTRGYHSTSILLPDGRVLHAGSGDTDNAPDEMNAELFSPPYLFKGPRPTLSAAPSRVGYGTSFRVVTPDASAIAKVSLIRLGSATHAFDMNQRFQWLSFARQSGALTITAPTSRNITPPGHYMLFILDGDGIPSTAKIVSVGSESDPDPPLNASPTASFLAACTGLACAFTDGSSDADGSVTGWSWDFGDGHGSTARHPDHTYAAEGTYDVTLTVTDDDAASGSVTKTLTVAPPSPPASPVASFTWSCDAFTCTFTDGSTDDGSVTGWSWDFGDNTGGSSDENPTHSYAEEGSYEVTLTVTDDTDKTGTTSHTITVTPPVPNTGPTPDFTWLCSGLSCSFTDASTDQDGSVTDWSWAFADGGSSVVRNPSHTYAAAGSYSVVLTATDNDGAAASVTHQVAVTAPSTIALSVAGRVDATKQYMTLTWTGASGATVDVYRDGALLRNELNDGRYTNSRNLPGASQYTYKVCQAGTTICSNDAKVTFGTSAPPTSSIVLSVRGWVDATKQYMALTWTGATGATVDVYRDGAFLRNELNDGKYTNSRNLPGASRYTYKVCEAGTTVCSNDATVVF